MMHWQFSVSSIMTTMARLHCIALIITMNVLMCVLAEEEELHPELHQYDDFDIQAVLNDDDVREAYYNCFMKPVTCQTQIQKAITGMFSEAYQTNCKGCIAKQREIVKLVSEWYMKNDPKKWQLILAKTIEDMKKNMKKIINHFLL